MMESSASAVSGATSSSLQTLELSGASTIPATAPLAPVAPTMLDRINEIKVTETSGKPTGRVLADLRKLNPVAFANALVELANREDVVETPNFASDLAADLAPAVDALAAPKAKKLTNEERANLIAKLVAPEVKDITPAVIQWATYRDEAKKSLATEFGETEANRAKETAFFNKYGEMQGVAIGSGLIRAAYSITKVVFNIFIGLGRLIASSPLNCCGTVQTKTEQRERAIQKWTHIKEDLLNTLCGLGQAVPFFGASVMSTIATQEARTKEPKVTVEFVTPKTKSKIAQANWAKLASRIAE